MGQVMGQRERAGDGVVDLDKANGEAAQLNHLPRLHRIERHAADMVFAQFVFNQRQRQARTVQGRGHLRYHIGHRADMILMTMRKHIAADTFFVCHQIAGVGDHQVDAQHIVLGEHGTAIDNDNIPVILKDRHIFADFIHASKGNDPQFWSICHSFPLSSFRTERRKHTFPLFTVLSSKSFIKFSLITQADQF